jgi:hypothetical protein
LGDSPAAQGARFWRAISGAPYQQFRVFFKQKLPTLPFVSEFPLSSAGVHGLCRVSARLREIGRHGAKSRNNLTSEGVATKMGKEKVEQGQPISKERIHGTHDSDRQ